MGLFNRKKTDPKKAPEASKKDETAAAKAVEAPKAAKKAAPETTGDAFRVLVRPLVTEKSTALAKESQYVFEVAPKANKIEVKTAIKAVYGVDAVRVRVMTILGKPLRTKSGYARRSTWRKAIVTLKKGETLDVFANA
jgi:large subunit ribosomal protein L23